jgi:uncharacterized protein YdcH (DUF465 family)
MRELPPARHPSLEVLDPTRYYFPWWVNRYSFTEEHMSTTEVSVEQLKTEVEALVGPFFDKYNGLDKEIKKREARIEEIKKEIVDLRGARSYLRTIVRNINPELIPPMHAGRNGNNGKKRKKGKTGFSVETKQAIVVWLQARREELNAMHDDLGFRPTDLYAHENWTLLRSESAVNKVLRDLHDEGVLALNKWVRGLSYPHRPTGKFYKVV